MFLNLITALSLWCQNVEGGGAKLQECQRFMTQCASEQLDQFNLPETKYGKCTDKWDVLREARKYLGGSK